jgi:hypothetical protein
MKSIRNLSPLQSRIDRELERQHNTALVSPRPHEAVILRLAEAIEAWAQMHAGPFSSVEIIEPMLDAFDAALNYERGRLSGAALSDWSQDMRKAYGLRRH